MLRKIITIAFAAAIWAPRLASAQAINNNPGCVAGVPCTAGILGVGTAPNLATDKVTILVRADAANAMAPVFPSTTYQNLTTGPTDSVFQEAFAFQTIIGGPLIDTWSMQLDPDYMRLENLALKYRGNLIMQGGRNAVQNMPLTNYGLTFYTGVWSQGQGTTNFTAETTTNNSNAEYRWDSTTIPGSGGKIWSMALRGSDLSGALTIRDISQNNDIISISPATGNEVDVLAPLHSIYSGGSVNFTVERQDTSTVYAAMKNTSQEWRTGVRADLSQDWALRDITGGVDALRIAHATGAATFSASVKTNAVIATGSPPTLTGTCTTGSQAGGNTAGKFTATCVSQTVIMTFATTAPNGWTCAANDNTTVADTLKQTAFSQTTCTVSGTTVASDVITFSAIGW